MTMIGMFTLGNERRKNGRKRRQKVEEKEEEKARFVKAATLHLEASAAGLTLPYVINNPAIITETVIHYYGALSKGLR